MSTDQEPIKRGTLRREEVLVGLFLLVLAAALVLPWLNWNHSHQRGRSEGVNQLKNIGLALHNYNDTHDGKLPSLTDFGPHAPHNAGLNSLFFNILPFLDYNNIYGVFKQTTSTYAAQYELGKDPSAAAIHMVKDFTHPADSTHGDPYYADVSISLPWHPPAPFLQHFSGRYSMISYAANGLVFGSNDAGLPRTFIDGTSNTVMIAQRPQACDPLDGSPPVYNLWAFGYYGPTTPAFALLTPDEPAGMPSTGQAAPMLPLPTEWTKDKIGVRLGRISAPVIVPAFSTPFQRVVKGMPCDPRILGTPHTSGLLVALGDGSVRTVAPDVSAWTFWASCTPAGNETLHSDW